MPTRADQAFPGQFRAGLATGLEGEGEGQVFGISRAEGMTWARARNCGSTRRAGVLRGESS